MRNNKFGFTLIELMIVIAIIGILSAVALPHFSRVRDRARRNRCYENSALLSRTAEIYYIHEKTYPNEVEDLEAYLSGSRLMPCPSQGGKPQSEHYKIQADSKANGPLIIFCTFHGVASATWGG